MSVHGRAEVAGMPATALSVKIANRRPSIRQARVNSALIVRNQPRAVAAGDCGDQHIAGPIGRPAANRFVMGVAK